MIKRFIVSLLARRVREHARARASRRTCSSRSTGSRPGKHEEFLRHLALLDQANAEAGLPPRQLFVHQDGASWDFVLLQPAHNTDEQNAKLDAAFKKLGIPQGAKFFVNFRKLIAEHTDTFVEQTTAAEYLKKLD